MIAGRQVTPGPITAGAGNESAVVVREVGRQPRPMPTLPTLEAGVSLKVGWDHGDPHALRRAESTAAEAWRRDYPWREVVGLENGYGHRQGVGTWIKALLVLPVLAGIVIGINATVFFVPGMWAEWRNVFGLPLEQFGAPDGWDVVAIANFLALAVIGAMVYTAVERLRFGRLRFRLLTFPARTGGPLRVELSFSRAVRATGPVECTLHCVDANRMPESSSDQAPVGTPVSLYRERLQLDSAGRRVWRLRVDFQIPPDAPATAIRSQRRVYWLLSFRIPARGPDYRGDFLVPVYTEHPV